VRHPFDGWINPASRLPNRGTNDIAVGGAPNDIGAGGVGGVANVGPNAGESSGPVRWLARRV